MRQRYIVQCRLVVVGQENIYTTCWLYAPVKLGDLSGKYKVVEIYGEPQLEKIDYYVMERKRMQEEGWMVD